jgi:predicted HicB family RNase H-like nuclease
VKRGRPRKLKSERRSVVLRYRMTKEEYRQLCVDAKRAGLSVSAFIRKKLNGGKS